MGHAVHQRRDHGGIPKDFNQMEQEECLIFAGYIDFYIYSINFDLGVIWCPLFLHLSFDERFSREMNSIHVQIIGYSVLCKLHL